MSVGGFHSTILSVTAGALLGLALSIVTGDLLFVALGAMLGFTFGLAGEESGSEPAAGTRMPISMRERSQHN